MGVVRQVTERGVWNSDEHSRHESERQDQKSQDLGVDFELKNRDAWGAEKNRYPVAARGRDWTI